MIERLELTAAEVLPLDCLGERGFIHSLTWQPCQPGQGIGHSLHYPGEVCNRLAVQIVYGLLWTATEYGEIVPGGGTVPYQMPRWAELLCEHVHGDEPWVVMRGMTPPPLPDQLADCPRSANTIVRTFDGWGAARAAADLRGGSDGQLRTTTRWPVM